MPEDLYNQVPYPTVPMAQTHPDRLASVATLFGMTPAPVTACRILELGCGSAGNLIPMAYFLPGSRFTGVDLGEDAVAEGRGAISELGLQNIELIAMDVCAISSELGKFDYIIAHGLYSWVPENVRDKVLAVCRELLAPQGVACISFNCLPGRSARVMLREMMLHHTRHCTHDSERIEQARDFLRMVGKAQLFPSAWQPMMNEEIEQMLTVNQGWFFHDDLAPNNHSFYVRDFAAHAAVHSLQYLGDAEVHSMLNTRQELDWLGDDVIEREQYMDFLYLRRFRHTLLCHREVRLERPASPKHMDPFLFSSPARLLDGHIEGLNSIRVPAANRPVARVAAALRDAYPLPVAFEKLLQFVGDRQELRDLLFESVRSGFAQLHIHHFQSGIGVSRRPRASRLARWESARTGVVTYSNHTALKLDVIVRALIELLNGRRKLDDVISGLARVEGAPSRDEIRTVLPRILAHMAATGLLEE